MKKRLAWAAAASLISLAMIPLSYAERAGSLSAYIEIIGTFTILAYLLQLHRDSHTFLYSSFYQIYSLVGIGISLVFIGIGTPMLEIDQEGTRNGAIWTTLLFLIVGLECGRLGFNQKIVRIAFRTNPLNPKVTRFAVITTSSIVLTIGLLILIRYGGAAFSGVTRVAFWNNIVPEGLRLYPSLLGQTFFLCAFLYAIRRKNGSSTIFELTIVLMYILATIIIAGEKFSSFIFYITVWLMLRAGLSEFRIPNKNILVASSITLALILAVLITNYSASDKDAVFILYRIAMQGQLLWSVLSEQPDILLFGHGTGCFLGCNSYDSGVDFISARYLPAGIWESYVDTGSGLTGFMPALPILTLGLPLAIIIHAAISFSFGMIQRELVKKIKYQDLVASLLMFKIYFALVVAWYASKTAALPGALVTLAILIAWALCVSPSKKP